MAAGVKKLPPLIDGQRLSREEFMRRYEGLPHVKKAELIGGIVRMPSPVSRGHGTRDYRLVTWLGVYEAFTPGCEGAANSTWLMLDDAPQPDADLRILPEFGGASGLEGAYAAGAPELIAEASYRSAALDLGDKKTLYATAGVREYVVLLVKKNELRWHRLVGGVYKLASIPKDGIIHSKVFPGLWLDVPALLKNDMAQVLRALHKGIGSREHEAFVNLLEERRLSKLRD